MARVQHPSFPLVVNEVPDADAPDWEAAGWTWLDDAEPYEPDTDSATPDE